MTKQTPEQGKCVSDEELVQEQMLAHLNVLDGLIETSEAVMRNDNGEAKKWAKSYKALADFIEQCALNH